MWGGSRPEALYFVMTLTTTPDRLPQLGPTLSSLAVQTRPADVILLNVPRRFARTGQKYPEVPAELRALAPQLVVNRCAKDWGPATKLVPAVRWLYARMDEIAARLGLRRSAAFDAVHLVVVDDDYAYPQGMLASLASTAEAEASECASGFTLRRMADTALQRYARRRARLHGSTVTVCEAFAGWRLPMAIFREADQVASFEAFMYEKGSDRRMYLADDLVVSDYLALRRVPIRQHTSALFNRTLLRSRSVGQAGLALHRTHTNGSRIAQGGRDANFQRYWSLIEERLVPHIPRP